MCAQNMRSAIVPFTAMHVKGIHFRPCRVMARNVESVKIIPVAVYARSLSHGKAHIGKNCCDLFRHLADGMDRALPPSAGRQSHV